MPAALRELRRQLAGARRGRRARPRPRRAARRAPPSSPAASSSLARLERVERLLDRAVAASHPGEHVEPLLDLGQPASSSPIESPWRRAAAPRSRSAVEQVVASAPSASRPGSTPCSAAAALDRGGEQVGRARGVVVTGGRAAQVARRRGQGGGVAKPEPLGGELLVLADAQRHVRRGRRRAGWRPPARRRRAACAGAARRARAARRATR